MIPCRYLVWGAPGQEQVDGETVPAGEVWLIQSAGIATEDYRALDYMLQHVVPPGWYVPLERSVQAGSTPVLALGRSIILQEGEYLRTRVNSGGQAFARMALLYTGWKFPASDLSKLLGLSVTAAAAPDFSAFAAQCQAAAQALLQIQAP